MSIKNMVNILQKKGVDKIIDTVYYSWNPEFTYNSVLYSREKTFPGNRYTGMQYRVISSKESTAERDSLANLYCAYEEKRSKEEKQEDFKTQLKKNYSPAAITQLGWINCDRFNNAPETETNIELPYAFNNTRIEYFVVFKTINGFISGREDCNETKKFVLKNMPVGQGITLIAFTKKNGIIYQAKEDFVVGKNKSLPVNFKEISANDMNKLFGSNVKI